MPSRDLLTPASLKLIQRLFLLQKIILLLVYCQQYPQRASLPNRIEPFPQYLRQYNYLLLQGSNSDA